MGKTVAVCSELKNTGKSVTTFILANQLREMGRQDLKILVCCLNFKYSLLYKLFKVNTSYVGLEELANLRTIKGETSENIESIIPQSNGIYFLGTYRMTDAFVQKNIESFKSLLEELKEKFDLIIFDTVSEKENILTDMVLDRADVILKLFVQDNESLTELNGVKEEKEPYNQEIIYMVSKYRNIYPKYRDIKRRFSLSKVYTVDYCETLQEMKNRDSLHLYIQRDTDCNNSVRRISGHILEALGLSRPPDNKVKEKTWRYLLTRQ